MSDLRSNLDAARAALHAIALASPTAANGADPVRAARDVFQGPDFWWKRIETKTMPRSSVLQAVLDAILGGLGRIWRAVWDAIDRVLHLLFGGFGGESSSGTLFVWLLAGAILAWAVWKLFPLFLQGLGREAPRVGAETVASEALPAADDLRAQAAVADRDGRHAEAIRLALLALIATFEKRGLLRYDATRTNREYRAELRRRPELAAGFGRLARIYEGVWYGREPASRESSAESIRLCESLVDAEALSP